MSQTVVLADVVYIAHFKTIMQYYMLVFGHFLKNNYAILHVGVWTFSKYIDQICIIFLTKILTVLNIHTFPTLTFKKDLAALIQ